MAQILIPASSPEDWQKLLAEPEKHWKRGYSARTLAYCWQEAQGFPLSVSRVFAGSGLALFEEVEPLLLIPEHQVSLPGGRRPSQNDIWILARSGGSLISIAVEGKVSEPFGPTLEEWFKDRSPGKRVRLEFLVKELGLPRHPPESTRYQLLHRTASSIIEAKRFTAHHAMMLVHSFDQADEGFDDYTAFVSEFGTQAVVNGVTSVGRRGEVEL